MYAVLLSFITAFVGSYAIIPTIINVALQKKLYDDIDERRSHKVITPSLGGVAIFAGFIFSLTYFTPFNVFNDLQYTLCAFIVIFLIGVKDDIVPMSPYKKLLGEVMAALILYFKSGVKITSLYGFFGINEIPEWFSLMITIFTIIVIINAFNLIDGINGLSGSITTIIVLTLGSWFYLVDQISLAIMAFSLAGATVGFLRYNYTPAQIFMGDTGALLLGLVSSILVIKFINVNQLIVGHPYAIAASPAVAVGILILPLFDTARVFAIRISHGRSPFTPDRLHIHHLLLDYGLTHTQATILLTVVSICFTTFVFFFHSMSTFKLLFLILVFAAILSFMLQKAVERKRLRFNSGIDLQTDEKFR